MQWHEYTYQAMINTKNKNEVNDEVNLGNADERKGMLVKHNPDKKLRQQDRPEFEKESLSVNKRGDKLT